VRLDLDGRVRTVQYIQTLDFLLILHRILPTTGLQYRIEEAALYSDQTIANYESTYLTDDLPPSHRTLNCLPTLLSLSSGQTTTTTLPIYLQLPHVGALI
jgi:hypothetical protein